jgi:hypothetical protein
MYANGQYSQTMRERHDITIRVFHPHPPLVIQQKGITIPGNGE